MFLYIYTHDPTLLGEGRGWSIEKYFANLGLIRQDSSHAAMANAQEYPPWLDGFMDGFIDRGPARVRVDPPPCKRRKFFPERYDVPYMKSTGTRKKIGPPALFRGI